MLGARRVHLLGLLAVVMILLGIASPDSAFGQVVKPPGDHDDDLCGKFLGTTTVRWDDCEGAVMYLAIFERCIIYRFVSANGELIDEGEIPNDAPNGAEKVVLPPPPGGGNPTEILFRLYDLPMEEIALRLVGGVDTHTYSGYFKAVLVEGCSKVQFIQLCHETIEIRTPPPGNALLLSEESPSDPNNDDMGLDAGGNCGSRKGGPDVFYPGPTRVLTPSGATVMFDWPGGKDRGKQRAPFAKYAGNIVTHTIRLRTWVLCDGKARGYWDWKVVITFTIGPGGEITNPDVVPGAELTPPEAPSFHDEQDAGWAAELQKLVDAIK